MRYDHFSMLPERAFQPIGKRMTLEGGGKGDAPAAPDYSQIAISNEKAAKIAAETAAQDLAFRKSVYADSQPRQQQLYDLASQIAGRQVGMMDQNQKIAADNNNYYNNTFQPIESQTVMDSMGSQYLSNADRARLASVMSGTSGLTGSGRTLAIDEIARNAQNGAADQARQQAIAQNNGAYSQQAQNLARMGLDPSRLAAAAAGLAQNQTSNQINAANQARTNTFNQQAGLRTGVANFGRNMPNTATQAYATAGNMGNSAVNNQNTGFQSGLPYANYVSGAVPNTINAANTQVQGNLGLGQLMNGSYATQMQGYNSGGDMLGGLMGLGSSLGSAYIMRGSDRNIKENIKRLGELDNGLVIYEFEYKEPYKNVWGHGRKIGVMADEVESVLPAAVSVHPDGYKVVDYSMIGAA
jgi:hypothetical protein